jgi:hypothetical protein
LKQESMFEIAQVSILVIMRSCKSSPLSNYKFMNIAVY